MPNLKNLEQQGGEEMRGETLDLQIKKKRWRQVWSKDNNEGLIEYAEFHFYLKTKSFISLLIYRTRESD